MSTENTGIVGAPPVCPKCGNITHTVHMTTVSARDLATDEHALVLAFSCRFCNVVLGTQLNTATVGRPPVVP
jgi:hypothetical protein